MAKNRVAMRRLFSVVIAVSLIAATLTLGCRESQEESNQISGAPESTQLPLETDEVASTPGVSNSRILFGQSAALTGPADHLGQQMRLGILAAFHEQNEAGGVHNRQLELTTLDDLYEPDLAFVNTRQLINNHQVFALIGEVGTPTSRSAAPLAAGSDVPFIAPFTGAEFLRVSGMETVVNLRASYHQETEEMVARLTEDMGITRIAVMYQNDSYGQAGLNGVLEALERRGLQLSASWHYQRNTSSVKTAAFNIVQANPEAVIMIGAYSPTARAIALMKQDIDPVFMAVSFVGSYALAEALGPQGAGVYVTQVVPLPDDTSVPAVAAFHKALNVFDENAKPGFVSLEGYLAGRLAIAGLQMCGPDLSRQCFLDSIRNAGLIEIDGITLQYGPNDNQGSDEVFTTVIGSDGEFHLVSELGGAR